MAERRTAMMVANEAVGDGRETDGYDGGHRDGPSCDEHMAGMLVAAAGVMRAVTDT